MKKAYICSPYKARNSAELDRNIEYAQHITKQALRAGFAPITPHLYLTQCLNENVPAERIMGIMAGLELLGGCELIIVGDRYGVSEGMLKELELAKELGTKIVRANEYPWQQNGGRKFENEKN